MTEKEKNGIRGPKPAFLSFPKLKAAPSSMLGDVRPIDAQSVRDTGWILLPSPEDQRSQAALLLVPIPRSLTFAPLPYTPGYSSLSSGFLLQNQAEIRTVWELSFPTPAQSPAAHLSSFESLFLPPAPEGPAGEDPGQLGSGCEILDPPFQTLKQG